MILALQKEEVYRGAFRYIKATGKKKRGIKESVEITCSSSPPKGKWFIYSISQGVQVPSLWQLSTNSGSKEKSEMQVSKQR